MRAVERAADLGRAVRDLEILERTADVLRGDVELVPCGGIGRRQRARGIEEQLRDRLVLERQFAQAESWLIRAGAFASALRHQQQAVPAVRLGHGPEHPPLQIDRREGGGVGEEHLGPAEDRVTRRIEREVEPLDDPRLRLRVEVHQRVAAEEQVDPRDRRVLQQIVPAEDHGPAQVAVDHEGAVDRIEVLRRPAPRGRH